MPEVVDGPVDRFLADRGGIVLDAATEPGAYARVAVVGNPRDAEWPPGVYATEIGLRGGGPVALVARPEWPDLVEVGSSRVDGEWWSVLRFAEEIDVAEVVAEVGRQSVWRDLDGPRARATDAGRIGPFDERVLNPTGFVPAADGPVVDVASLGGITAPVVAGLRSAAAVAVERWDDAATRAAAALAMAGVPVVTAAPGAVPDSLGPELRAVLAEPVDLSDVTSREERSVLLRRAAFDRFSSRAQGPAGRPRHPSVSILIATRRADMLDFALAQVARQRGVDELELVLAPHGFDVPLERVQEAVGPGVAVQVMAQPDTTLFGDVLESAARAAGGDLLLKMDDDDWYAPDVVADLLRAHAWSGAELVGMPAELHYLAEADLTAKRGHPVELYTSFVAGGTMLVERAALREAGGFRPVRKWVDAQLIDGLDAIGAATYRTHGLGYVLRRNATGHTWQVDLDYLLDPARTIQTWPGFRPSRLLEPDPRWMP